MAASTSLPPMVTVASVGVRCSRRSRPSCSPATVVEVAPSLASRASRAVGLRVVSSRPAQAGTSRSRLRHSRLAAPRPGPPA
jgi:hypothetical protein